MAGEDRHGERARGSWSGEKVVVVLFVVFVAIVVVVAVVVAAVFVLLLVFVVVVSSVAVALLLLLSLSLFMEMTLLEMLPPYYCNCCRSSWSACLCKKNPVAVAADTAVDVVASTVTTTAAAVVEFLCKKCSLTVGSCP